MKLFIVAFFIGNLANQVFAQKGCSIIYEQKNINILDGESNFMDNRVIITDTFNFHYFLLNKISKKEANKKVFNVNKHHQTIVNNYTNFWYHFTQLTENKDAPFLIKYAIKQKWTIYADSVNFLGYKCKLALDVDNNGDSTLAWFTTEMHDFVGGPIASCNLPGVVLKLYIQKYRQKYIAKKIDYDDYTVYFPKDVAIVNEEDYKKRKVN